nr:AT-rich interactive domain-containing protein 5B-like isoform X1 [Paramormyrops kingsleyae]
MEQNAIQWLGAPCCLRGSFAFYKSFTCSAQDGRRAAVWRLGEFYFVRCAPHEPACIAELTLLWEDREQRHQLASSRLYFLPEDTPKGRMGEHGEDEVLAVSRKIVIRVEDLVKWACPEPAGWKARGYNPSVRSGLDGGAESSKSLDPQDNKADAESQDQRRVKVLSYPQYCRFRSLQRRMQDWAIGPAPLDPHLLALGGIRAALRHTRVLYCRDTFNHPTLDSNASVWTRLGCTSLSLKGRPRKRRGRDGKGPESQNHSHSVASWIDKMKESVMGSVELPWEGGWLPHPEEQPFLDQLYLFMESRGSPINKVPNLGFKKIDLFLLYSIVKRLGGYEQVTTQRLWKRVYNELGGSPGSTSAATCTRRHYEKLMLAYEQHLTGSGGGKPGPQRAPVAAPCGSGEQQKARAPPVVHKKRVGGSPCQEGKVGAKGVEVRRRGRPNRRQVRATAKARQVGSSPPKAPPPCSLDTPPQDTPLQPPPVPLQHGVPSAPDAAAHGAVGGVQPASLPPLQPKTELALGPLSLHKGFHPLELFKAHLGLSGEECLSPAPQPLGSTLRPPVLFIQAKAGTPAENGGAQIGGPVDARSPVGSFQIIPLDNLHVRKLMRARMGTSELNSFTRKLLAQDLSKVCRPSCPQPEAPEQLLPLNLSKRGSVDSERPDSMAKKMRPDWAGSGGTGLGLKVTIPGMLAQPTQEEAADLSSPRRARACVQEWATHSAGSGGTAESSSEVQGHPECVKPENDLRGCPDNKMTDVKMSPPETPTNPCLDRICWPPPRCGCVDTHAAVPYH